MTVRKNILWFKNENITQTLLFHIQVKCFYILQSFYSMKTVKYITTPLSQRNPSLYCEINRMSIEVYLFFSHLLFRTVVVKCFVCGERFVWNGTVTFISICEMSWACYSARQRILSSSSRKASLLGFGYGNRFINVM